MTSRDAILHGNVRLCDGYQYDERYRTGHAVSAKLTHAGGQVLSSCEVVSFQGFLLIVDRRICASAVRINVSIEEPYAEYFWIVMSHGRLTAVPFLLRTRL